MRTKVHAVTVSKNYLQPNLFTLKLLSVGERKSKQPFWFVHKQVFSDSNLSLVVAEAKRIAEKYNVPYIPAIRHGQSVTVNEKVLLAKYGVTVK